MCGTRLETLPTEYSLLTPNRLQTSRIQSAKDSHWRLGSLPENRIRSSAWSQENVLAGNSNVSISPYAQEVAARLEDAGLRTKQADHLHGARHVIGVEPLG